MIGINDRNCPCAARNPSTPTRRLQPAPDNRPKLTPEAVVMLSSFQEGLVKSFGVIDYGAAQSVSKFLVVIGVIISALAISAVCPEDAARVIILLSTVFTLMALAPFLLVGFLLSFATALFMSLVLTVALTQALSFGVDAVCKRE